MEGEADTSETSLIYLVLQTTPREKLRQSPVNRIQHKKKQDATTENKRESSIIFKVDCDRYQQTVSNGYATIPQVKHIDTQNSIVDIVVHLPYTQQELVLTVTADFLS